MAEAPSQGLKVHCTARFGASATSEAFRGGRGDDPAETWVSHEKLFRALPGVDELLGDTRMVAALRRHGRRLVVAELRGRLAALREAVRGEPADWAPASVAERAAAIPDETVAALERRADGRLRVVLNATGVIVHTNLGRAPLGRLALERLAERAGSALNLELDLPSGRRGGRGAGVDELLVTLTGAEAAAVVNNNAAALLLALNALARGRPVIVARGELVEIGGSFRLPDVCHEAGVRLVEIGTTNRTRLDDYRAALDAHAGGLLLKVHPSNFRVVGFTQEASLDELVALGRERSAPVVMDQGSGVLEDLSPWGVVDESPVPELVATGADLVLFSGDKLLGGPQAGCMVGRSEAVAACRRSALYRALRPGRLSLLALEATLWAHASGRLEDVPVQAALRMPVDEIDRRATAVVTALRADAAATGWEASVVDGVSTSGGGSSPESRVPTRLVRLVGRTASPDGLARELRLGAPPVVARIRDDGVVLDLRTVPPDADPALVAALRAALASIGG